MGKKGKGTFKAIMKAALQTMTLLPHPSSHCAAVPKYKRFFVEFSFCKRRNMTRAQEECSTITSRTIRQLDILNLSMHAGIKSLRVKKLRVSLIGMVVGFVDTIVNSPHNSFSAHFAIIGNWSPCAPSHCDF